ncbi:hypothetical protein KAT24_01600 [Candidatus Pacearchaeota archaeon]|nr:hypothetical protein [Candidatus Pacearchaeota archaeon]
MRKKEILIGLILMFTLLSSFLVMADVCCEKTIDLSEDSSSVLIFECLDAPLEQCDDTYRTAPTSCDQTGYCQLGTCINTNTGTCMPNSPRQPCIDGGGFWIGKDKEDIEICQEGCCGDGIAFVTLTECKQMATDYGFDTNFRPDIRDAETCYALASAQERGACVIEAEFTKDCTMETRNTCPEDATFHEGFLCTAPGVSDCAKSGDTKCEGTKVYFLDKCDNLANVYDENMFTDGNHWTQEMEDYWTYMQEPSCEVNGADATCGDCSYRAGTMCKEYDRWEEGMPNKAPEYGNYVCADLSCYYDTDNDGTKEVYNHGESWCAESEGTYWGLPGIIESTTEGGVKDSIRIELEDITKYHLPGSRYYRLLCWDGEVTPYKCKDYRNEVCKEVNMGTDESRFMYGQCMINDWRPCFDVNNSIDCEDSLMDCKWIKGHRFDRKIKENKDEQGSCVPLYTPGFDFWEPESDAHEICALGTTEERVFYETGWWKNRDTFGDAPTIDAAHRCLENCYAIPDYGSDEGLNLELIEGLYNEEELPNAVSSYHLSTRRGHYCFTWWDLIFGEEMASGTVAGTGVDCLGDKHRRVPPLFYTHNQWLKFVRTRARSLGDCGFKKNFMGESGEKGAELITAIFQKLDQEGNVKEEGEITIETIYIGEDRIYDEYREEE